MFRKTIVPLGKKKRKKKFNKCHNGKKWPFVACQGIPGPQGPDSPGLSQDSAKALQDPSIPLPAPSLLQGPAALPSALRRLPPRHPETLSTLPPHSEGLFSRLLPKSPGDSPWNSRRVFPQRVFPENPNHSNKSSFFYSALDVTEYRPYLVALASDCVCFSGAVCLLFGDFGELKGGGVEGRGHCFVCVSSLSSGIFMAHLFFARRGPGRLRGDTPNRHFL